VPLTALIQVNMCPRAQLKLPVCRWRLSSKNNHEKTLFGSHGAQYRQIPWSWQFQNLAEVTAQRAWKWNLFLLDVCPRAQLKLSVCRWRLSSKNNHEKTLFGSHGAPCWPSLRPWFQTAMATALAVRVAWEHEGAIFSRVSFRELSGGLFWV